jgi:hypothetical protein
VTACGINTEGNVRGTRRCDGASSGRARRRLFAVPVLALVTLSASDVQAYRTAADMPEFAGSERITWSEGPISYQIYDRLPSGVDLAALEASAADAFAVWDRLHCGGVPFEYDGAASAPARPNDGINTIEWVTEGWADRGFPPQAGGFTDIGFARGADDTWRIVEADLYINGDAHNWIVGPDLGIGPLPVASLLVHEGGHMLGLMHPCEVDAADGVPDCGEHPEMGELAMHPLYDARRVQLREDDFAGACFLYPGVPNPAYDPAAGLVTTVDCSGNADACPRGLECREGSCEGGALRAGDPCEAHTECWGRVCMPDGFCGTPCHRAEDCGSEQTCEVLDEWGSVCSGPALAPLGTPCESGAECISGQCVNQDPGPTFCSRLCDEAECPEDWECKTVEERMVCVPYLVPVHGGCRIAERKSQPATGAALFVAMSSLLAARLRNTRRRSKARRC